MKALVFHGPHHLTWEDWPNPEARPGEVVMAVHAVGICGADLNGYMGVSDKREPPLIMGHEATGEVIAIGHGVPESYLGKRFVIRPNVVCGTCKQCRSGYANLCKNRYLIGVKAPGAMAERVSIPAENLLPLPEDIDSATGTLVEPLAVGVRAARQVDGLSGKSVFIAGCGTIGLLTMIAVRHYGARVVYMSDVLPYRRRIALEMGANEVLDPKEDKWIEKILQASGGEGFDAAFDAVGIQATFNQALQSIHVRGVVVAIGGWQSITLDLGQIVRRELRLAGTLNYTPEDFSIAHQLLIEHAFNPDQILTNQYPLQDGEEVFKNIAQNLYESIKVVLTCSHPLLENR
jgi:2-desacetyl-2-hydroxyethyl bacteriochlorophyllide A dehydrogenase